MPESEKVKVKLSELTDMYDIEDDSKVEKKLDNDKKTPDEAEWEYTISESDKKLEEEFEENGA